METIYDFLAVHAQSKTNDEAFTFIEDNGETSQISFSELHHKAQSIAQYLKTRCAAGSRVVLLFPPGLEYIQSFLGCLYAGVVAVPLYPPQSKKHAGRVLTVIDDCKADLVLTNGLLKSQIEGELAPLPVLGFEQLSDENAERLDVLPQAEQIAFLQYTSGSTGTPKGVVVTHGNIIANLKTLQQATHCNEQDVFCNWLPLFHDLGLVNTLLLPIFLGAHSVLMSPVRFIRNPMTWVSAITEYKGTIGGAPNFAFDHCLERIKPHQMAGLDLSSWRIAFNAAEPLDADTLMRFCERFARVGFKESAIFPAYGMAEATVFICGGNYSAPYVANAFVSDGLQKGKAQLSLDEAKQQILIAHGDVQPEHHLKIVSPETMAELPEGEVGEIWFAGPSLAQGYWNDEEKTKASFGARLPDDEAHYLRTGDLGFIHQGELYISGRIKDVMIIKGRNYYPQDFEKLAYNVYPGLNQNGAAAFEINGHAVLLLEVSRNEMKDFDFKLAAETIKSAIFEQFEVVLEEVVFLKAGRINRTSSGKIQRSLSKKRYLANDLESLYSSVKGLGDGEPSQTEQADAPVSALEAQLCALWQETFGIDRIGVDDNFLNLGGHSLLATSLIAQIQKKWHAEVSIRDFFSNNTIRKLAKVIESASVSAVPAIEAESAEGALLPSYAQERMWLVNQIESDQAQYNLSYSVKLYGELNISVLEKAFATIVDRHQALRTTYREEHGEILPQVQDAAQLSLPVMDLSELNPAEQGQRIAQLRADEANKRFNLAEDLLLRVTLLKLNSQSHILLVTAHHIASDGWSLGVLTKELNALYNAWLHGSENPLAPLSIQYSDYARWQRNWLTDGVLQGHLDYWRQHLEHLPVVHGLPLDKPRPAVPSFKGATVHHTLSQDLQDALHRLAQQNDATFFMLMNAAFACFLSRYSGETDIVIGSPVANREQSELAPLIGLFINNLVFRSDLSGDPSFIELLQQSKERTFAAQEHQQTPFAKLVDALQPERSLSHSPLFQVMLILQNQEVEPLNLTGLEAKQLTPSASFAQYDLTLTVEETDNGLEMHWQYASDLFAHASIERMVAHFEVMLQGIVNAPESNISQLPLLSNLESNQVLTTWNDTKADFPQDKCLHQLFEQQVQATPEAVAAIYGDEALTYEQLNQRANQLAHYLVQQGVTPDSFVGVCVERSMDMLISVLAIMKAGGAYLPMDPAYPKSRLQHMSSDSDVKWVITLQALQQQLSFEQAICLDAQQLQEEIAGLECSDIDSETLGLTTTNLAYLIYTSGSTGKPKGVMLEHSNVTNFLASMQKAPGFQQGDKLLAVTSLSFDIHVLELFLPLMTGGQVIIASSEAVVSPDALVSLMETHNVTTMQATPSTWKMLLNNDWQPENPLKVLCGGEALSSDLKDALLSRVNVELWNMYGPTETAVWSATTNITRYISLGAPIANTQCYVLDEHLNPVPTGVAGELYIAGAGVARGYLNQPQLTAQRFIDNPFSDHSNARMYKTGDLVRWLANGTLEYIRRVDLQVKVRGHRIELEEIETTLKQHSEVADAVAHVWREGDDANLIAYIVAKASAKEDLSDRILAHLEANLPGYMIPSAIMTLEQIPLTPNGKTNRNALPKPQVTDKAEYVAPENETEEQLCQMWQALLNIDTVGVTSNFFQLGGHSLLAARLVALIRQQWNVEVPIRTLFTEQTIRKLARVIEFAATSQVPKILPQAANEPVAVSYDQQRLWLLDQIEQGSTQYNLCRGFQLAGKLDTAALNFAFQSIVERHHVLRTTFHTSQSGEATQRVSDEFHVSLPVVELQGLSDTEQKQAILQHMQEETDQVFDLSKDLMLRVKLLKFSAEAHALLVTMHHIAVDGWSEGIIIKEFTTLYQSFVDNKPAPLAPLEIQYTDYAWWQNNWLKGDVLEHNYQFWKAQLQGIPEVHNLPLDHARPAVQKFEGLTWCQTISKDIQQGLHALANKYDVTLFMVLNAAYAVLLARYSNEDDIVVGTPVANRDQAELAPLVGFFVNTLVLRTDLSDNPTFATLLQRSKDYLLGAYEHQQLPFERLVDELQPDRSLSYSPLVQVKLALQNNELGQFELPDLSINAIEQEQSFSKLDLSLDIFELQDDAEQGMLFLWEYATALFDTATIEQLGKHFEVLLQGIIAAPETTVGQLPVLTADETKRMLDVAQTNVDAQGFELAQNVCIHELFEQQVARNPNATAVVFSAGRNGIEEKLSYAELNAAANQVAHYLIEQGVKPDTLVGICVERSVEMMIGQLGVLKAGGAYVPIDPGYPQERIEYILEDSGVEILLTENELLSDLPLDDQQILPLDEEIREALLDDYSEENISKENLPGGTALNAKHLAYVIYTSGSTGKPKGVLIEHAGIVNLAKDMQQRFGYNQDTCILQYYSFAFDAGAEDWIGALTSGGTLRLISNDDLLDLSIITQVVNKSKVTHLHVPPSVLALLDPAAMPSIKTVEAGGEKYSQELVDKWAQNAQFFNVYGPTETSISSSFKQCLVNDEVMSIGRAIPHVQYYVLDRHLAPCPVGVAGELFIGGVGLGRGYINQPELTAEKFIANPFYDEATGTGSDRLYRTGDLVRFIPGTQTQTCSGDLEFLGRIDQQVKIRGFRVELSEIESVLLQHEQLNDVAVIDRDTPKKLVAYFTRTPKREETPAQSSEQVIDALRNHLKQSLPDYMMPSAFVMLAQLPLTSNGKVDRKALLAIDVSEQLTTQKYVAPETDAEKQLCAIWQELLKIQQVGITDNFFALGGDSILAIQAVNRATQAGLGLTTRQLFESQTIEKLATQVNTQTGESGQADIPDADLLLRDDLTPEMQNNLSLWQQAYPNLAKAYATTGMQQGMLFHSSLDKSAYVSQLSVTLVGKLNIDALKQALSTVIGRHDVYRTVFTEDFMHQLVLSEAELPFNQRDLSQLESDVQQHRLAALVQQDKTQGFVIAQAPLMRLTLVTLAEEKHCLIWSNHHALTDGWSLPLVFKEVMALYVAAAKANAQSNLSSMLPAVQPYGSYISWLAQQAHDQARNWWQQTLSDVLSPTQLDVALQTDTNVQGARKQSFTLTAQQYAQLQTIAKQYQVTLNTLVQAAWAFLLHRYSGEQQVIFGETVSGRPADIAGVEQMVGLFINSLPVLVKVDRNEAIGNWLKTLNQAGSERADNGFLPLTEIQNLSPLSKGSEKERNLFDTLVVFENYPVDQEIEKVVASSALEVADIQNDEQTNYALTLTVLPENAAADSQLTFELAYRAEHYAETTVARLLTQFAQILNAIQDSRCNTLQDLTDISNEHQTEWLQAWNDTALDYPKDKCLHELFEGLVELTPDAVAMVFDGESLTYRQLNQRANQLAHYLVEQGVEPDSVVGLCVERSAEMLIGVLGIMKAGGAYLPMDPTYPQARLVHMVADSGVRWIITQTHLTKQFTVDLFSGGLFSAELSQQQTSSVDQVICIDDEAFCKQLATLEHSNINKQDLGLSANNLAYLIYTSGSTGKPKGVMLEHHNATNFLTSMQLTPGLTQEDTLLAVTSLSFDIHVLELYLPLITGAKVVIANADNVGSPDELAALIDEHQVTTMQATPATWKMLLNNGWQPEHKFKALCGGEALSNDLKAALLACQNIELWNMYGPTETAVWSATGKIEDKVSLGTAIANTQLYVLDNNLTPVPVGVAGELYIGGEGVARGYLNQPELTAERFIANPFSVEPESRLYKTGDLVRWETDENGEHGQLSYIARVDQQVKLRGYRIEPGEIETRLNHHPEIQESVVVARGEEGSKYLVAFYLAKASTAESLKELDAEALKSSLRQDLPEYMVPAAWISLAEIPLTPNGKVNRKALETMDLDLASEQGYVAPRNETEQTLAAIWAEVLTLPVEKIGVHDRFFELGGHSLLATQVIAKIRSQFATELPLKTLFDQETIAELASTVMQSDKSQLPQIMPVDRATLLESNQSLPLSYVQERLWFIDQLDPDSAGYNIPGAVTIKSHASRPLNTQEVEQAMNLIIARHENLRSLYPGVEGKVQQVILQRFDFKLASVDLGHIASYEERLQQAQALCQKEASTPFDLGKGPLIRGQIIRLSDTEHVLLLNMHHIISDGWSMSVIINEFRQIMAALEQGNTPELPALPVQYLDYSVWQRNFMEDNGVLDKQLDYWREKLSGVPERLNLATDFPRPKEPNFEGATEVFHIDAELTQALNQLTEKHGATLYMTLQAAFKALLYRYTGQEDICFGGSIANRQHEETAGLIGMFANTLVYRDLVEGDASFTSLLAQVKNTCLEAYEHQDTPFEKIVDLVQPDRTIGISPLFQVMFVLHNVAMALSDDDIQDFPLELNFSRFDLIVHFTETPQGLDGMLVYKTALFKQQTIARMVQHFTALCRAIVAAPEAKIAQLNYVSKEEQQTLLVANNTNQLDYPKHKCIHQLFTEQVSANPDKVALIEAGEANAKQLSFRQLEQRSETLAVYLQSLGVKPDGLVGLCVERSLGMMVGLLGILKSGGAYVPLDPEYPQERLSYMLQDSQAGIVITQAQFKDKVQALVLPGTEVLVLDDNGCLNDDIVAEIRTQGLSLVDQAQADNLAYVIYTSGSTGQPKGVMIEHRMVVDYCYSVVENMDLLHCDTFAAVSTFASDLGNIALYVPMLFSKTLTLFSNEYVNNPTELHAYMDKHPIDCMKITPSHFEMFKVSDTRIVKVEKALIFAGEALTKPVVDLVNQLNPGCQVFNNYGPTETTISKIASDPLTAENTDNTTSIVLGKPLNNTQVYILDKEHSPVPAGVPGELHIAGDGVARGYLNRPEMTQEKFVANPFLVGGRMYKTGDLARWLDDGNIEYLGRIDTQVKIRGFRIETAEIESVLNQHEAIANSVVVAQSQENEDGLVNKQLIAFYVTVDAAEAPDSEALKEYLLQTLPEYMVPMAFACLEEIPLLANGKVDRNTLEQMNISLASGQLYVAPRNELEEKLVSIWAGILQTDPATIGINDDFFSLGGHSLLAVMLVSKVKREMQIKLPLQALFNLKTISGTAEYIIANTTLEQPEGLLVGQTSEESEGDYVEGAL